MLVQEVRFACEIANQATGLGDQQGSGCDVPGLQPLFKETVGVAGRDVGQIEGGCTGAAQARTALHHFTHHDQVLVEIVTAAVGEAGRNQGVFELRAFGHPNAAVVQERTASLGGRKQIVAGGIVDHRLFHFATHGQRDADTINGQTVNKVGGAVQGVNDPDEFGILGTLFAS